MNYFEDDTIAAISTPVGQGGIGIVRISGPQSISVAEGIFRPRKAATLSGAASHSMLFGHVIDPSDGRVIDEALVSVMRSPNSYTKEDIIEFNCHGGMLPVKRLLEVIIAQGARLAEPGEFTKRAFLNGRISLTQAEAVSDLIAARTDESRRIAIEQLKGGLSEKLLEIKNSLLENCAFAEAHIDFPEDELETKTCQQMSKQLIRIKEEMEKLAKTFQEARFFREGLSVAIVGKPNVGKSSLLNALLKKDRAIVTEFPGTTRDPIEDYLDINGLPVRIIDTAGIRNSDEPVEKEGIKRSLNAIINADFVIAMLDGSKNISEDDIELLKKIMDKNALVAVNKSDLPIKISLEDILKSGRRYLHISAVSGEGLEELKTLLVSSNLRTWKEDREGIVITNIRHKQSLERACSAMERAVNILGKQPLEIFSIELRDALNSIAEITGAVTTEDILNKIFCDFCVGK